MSVASENNAVTFTLSTNCVSKLPEVKIISIFKRRTLFLSTFYVYFPRNPKKKGSFFKKSKKYIKKYFEASTFKISKNKETKRSKKLGYDCKVLIY